MADLIPLLVLCHLPNASQLHVQPVLAANADDAIAMAGSAMVKQGMGDGLVIGVLDRNGLDAMYKLLNGLDEVLKA